MPRQPMAKAPTAEPAEAEGEVELSEEALAEQKAARKAAKKAAYIAEEAEGEQAEQDEAAKKAAKKIAKLIASGEAEQTEADEEARKAAKKLAKLAANAKETEAELDEDAEKAARKAARKAAKAVAEAEEEAEDDEEAQMAAKKAAKKAAKQAEETAQAEKEAGPEAEDEEAKAARKAAKKLAKANQAAEEEAEAEAEAAEAKKKRKLGEEQPGEQVKAKKQKDADGDAVPSNVLGADAYRTAHVIVCDKQQCGDPFETFEAAAPQFGKALANALLAQGYAAPTPIQAQGWPIILQGKDIVAVAKTGSGKTCAFLLPVLARIAERGPAPPLKRATTGWTTDPARPSALVMAPTRELAQQIAVEGAKFAPVVRARVVAVYGGVPKGDQCRELRQGCDICIATPGRLLDLAVGSPDKGILPAINLEAVTYLVLDEADRMLDMGFEPDIRKVCAMMPASGKPETSGGASGPESCKTRQTLFFTATWPKDVQQTAASLTSSEAVQVRIGQGSGGDKLTANAAVKQVVHVLTDYDKPDKLREILKDNLKEGETAIVFCGMKSTCDYVENEMIKAQMGCWVRAIHSGKEQWVRDETLAKFRSLTAGSPEFPGKRGVLVATDVASRGLDIPGVAMVIVYDFGTAREGQNGGVESYVHRIGRTGRAGKKGRAWTFFTSLDRGALELVDLLKGVNQEVPQELVDLGDGEWWYRQKKSKGKGKGKSWRRQS